MNNNYKYKLVRLAIFGVMFALYCCSSPQSLPTRQQITVIDIAQVGDEEPFFEEDEFYICAKEPGRWICPVVTEKNLRDDNKLANTKPNEINRIDHRVYSHRGSNHVNRSHESETYEYSLSKRTKSAIRNIVNSKSDDHIEGLTPASKQDDQYPYPNAMPFLAVLFQFDKFDLTQEAKSVLNQHMHEFENKNPWFIEGRTDSVGEKAYNDQLATRRALSVKHFLIENGVQEDTLLVSGAGKCCYATPNDTEENRALNRRVNIYKKSQEQNNGD